MMKEEGGKDENYSKREAEANMVLQKLIRLDCRDSNFHYRDRSRNVYLKIYYPHTITQVSSSEHMLKQFWRHIQTYYFKKLDADENLRLQYLHDIFDIIPTGSYLRFRPDLTSRFQPQFSIDLQQTFTQAYLKDTLAVNRPTLNTQNWLKSLYIQWQMIDAIKHLPIKALTHTQTQLANSKHLLTHKASPKHTQKLKEQQKLLDSLLEQSAKSKEPECELSSLISQLYSQLQQGKEQTNLLLENLDASIEDEMRQEQSSSSSLGLNNQLDCIEFTIDGLEKRQVAESICKVLSCEKIGSQIYYVVTFESAINIDQRILNQREMEEMNRLRESPLSKFYRTGIKSPYSFICHNYAGFKLLYKDRYNLSRFNDRNMLDVMKKNISKGPNNQQIQDSFDRFSMCHHCKLLMPDYLLVTCRFASDRQAMPKLNLQTSYEPDFSETHTEDLQKVRAYQRVMARRKSCLMAYAKINEQYVCRRRYCFNCLKDTYPSDGMLETGICAFCKGNCMCSRCTRNDKIIKLKNLYSFLGGNVTQLQGCYFESLETKDEQPVKKGRGRPRKIIKKQAPLLQHKFHNHAKTDLGERLDKMKLLSWKKKGRRVSLGPKREDKSCCLLEDKAVKQFSLKKQLLAKYSAKKMKNIKKTK